MRIGRRSVTIAYRLDSLGVSPTMLRRTKVLPSAGACESPSMSAALSPTSSSTRRRAPAPGARGRDRARACSGCGCRCRSRSTTSISGCSPEPTAAATLVDCGYRRSRRPRTLWERHIATTLASMPIRRIIATHYHPDHVGNARVALGAVRRAGRDDSRRVPDRATPSQASSAAIRRKRRSTSFAATACPEADVAALGQARQRRTGAACPDLPQSFDRMLGGDVQAGGRHGLAGHRRPRAFAGARIALLRGAWRAHLRRHAAAERYPPTSAYRRRSRRRSAPALPRFARRVLH